MSEPNPALRVYGCRYRETCTVTELDDLAGRMLDDLPGLLPADAVPTVVEFGIVIVASVLLRLEVGGLPDHFTFADRISQLHSRRAIRLRAWLTEFMESYNWSNPDDGTDRRFFTSVYLLSEADYHDSLWAPGVLRAL